MSIRYTFNPSLQVIHIHDSPRLWDETINTIRAELDSKTSSVVDAFTLLFDLALPLCRSCDTIIQSDFVSWACEEKNTREFTRDCIERIRIALPHEFQCSKKYPNLLPKKSASKVFESIFQWKIQGIAKRIFQRWIWCIMWQCYFESFRDFASLVDDLKIVYSKMKDMKELSRRERARWESHLESLTTDTTTPMSWAKQTDQCQGNWRCTWLSQPSAFLLIESKILQVTCSENEVRLLDTSLRDVARQPLRFFFEYTSSGGAKREFHERIHVIVAMVERMDILCKNTARMVVEYIVSIAEIWEYLFMYFD